jgi:hypothetical protein
LMPIALEKIIAVTSLLAALSASAYGIYLVVMAVGRDRQSRQRYQRDRAIRNYAGLGKVLQQKYGKQAKYTPAQVKATSQSLGYSADYDCFGIAMYCDRADFTNYHDSIGESCNYESMRSEVSYCLFGSAVTTFELNSLAETDFQFQANGSDLGGYNYAESGSADVGHHSHVDYGGYSDGGDFGGGDY